METVGHCAGTTIAPGTDSPGRDLAKSGDMYGALAGWPTFGSEDLDTYSQPSWDAVANLAAEDAGFTPCGLTLVAPSAPHGQGTSPSLVAVGARSHLLRQGCGQRGSDDHCGLLPPRHAVPTQRSPTTNSIDSGSHGQGTSPSLETRMPHQPTTTANTLPPLVRVGTEELNHQDLSALIDPRAEQVLAEHPRWSDLTTILSVLQSHWPHVGWTMCARLAHPSSSRRWG